MLNGTISPKLLIARGLGEARDFVKFDSGSLWHIRASDRAGERAVGDQAHYGQVSPHQSDRRKYRTETALRDDVGYFA